MPIDIPTFKAQLVQANLIAMHGFVQQVVGLVIGADGPPNVAVGELCKIKNSSGRTFFAEVVGFNDKNVMLMSLGDPEGITPGSTVIATGGPLQIPVCPELLGRVIDGLGRPLDERPSVVSSRYYPLMSKTLNPLTRRRIKDVVSVGVRAIDGLLTLGKGPRIGIFAGSGVGKSTLMGTIARNTSADINVIGLIGERGREVKEFIEKDLGPEALKRSVVVAATSDQPALIRIKGALIASAIAEYFRDQGYDVMLMMDSVTRFAMAQREVGLSIGEPPAMKGYTPSVFAMLPKLLERAGTSDRGTITGLYTILVDADDFNEPISDAARGILDGHIILSRALAAQNHYPAIDILPSLSRLMSEIADPEHKASAAKLREVLAVYKDAEDLLNIGAYVAGSNPKIDYARKKIDEVNNLLKQKVDEKINFENIISQLKSIFKEG